MSNKKLSLKLSRSLKPSKIRCADQLLDITWSGQSNQRSAQRVAPTLLVHPVLPWVKIKPATVEEDGNFEVFDIPEAAHPSFE